MSGINKIVVSLNIEGVKHEVGELVLSERKIYFRYNSDFIRTGLNLSPIKLPFNTEIHPCNKEPFDGLFGVFNDSLPDGWGRLLLDRNLNSKEINISQISPLDQLAYVGTTGMGALIYQPEFDLFDIQSDTIELDRFNQEMNNILKGASSDILEELFALGGSSGGARPKIFVAYNSASDEIIPWQENLPLGFEHWIIKFPSSFDNPEIAKIEYAYYKMAVKAGIEMSECKLFEGKSGQLYFGTKRFDRIKNKRIHVHTASGLMHDNFRASTMDYGHLMDCAFRLERHVKAYEKVFRLAAFNVFAHNRDDHSKNFSFIMNKKGEWQFAPAYDLTYSYSSYGYHSTTIAGESQNPGMENLMKLAQHFGLKNGKVIIEEVQKAISEWKRTAQELEVSKENSRTIESSIDAIRNSK